MARTPKLIPEQIKAAADRAEGVAPDTVDGSPQARIGRPSTYQKSYAEQAKRLCELGATDIEVADFFDVSIPTLYRWKIKYPEFDAVLKAAKESADERVERSLYFRATGYSFESEKVFQYQGKIVRANTREHVPPDTTAMIFWLKNRRPDRWRDVHKHEHGKPGEFDQLQDHDLAKEMQREIAEIGPALTDLAAKPNGKAH